MTTFVRCGALAVVAAISTLAPPAAAQLKVEVSGTLGYYSPMGSFEPASQYSRFLPSTPGALSGIAFGGALRLWITPRFGAQLAATTSSTSFGYTGMELQDRAPGNGPLPINESIPPTQARVSTATAQILYQMLGNSNTPRVWLSAGGAAVRHGGNAYAPFGNPVSYGGAVGLGSAIHIKGPLSAELGLTTMIYRINLRNSTDPGLQERGTQVDALFHTGVSYRWH